MKPQAQFVDSKVVEQNYSTFMDSKHSFYIFASTSEYNFQRISKTKKPSFTSASWKYFKHKTYLWQF